MRYVFRYMIKSMHHFPYITLKTGDTQNEKAEIHKPGKNVDNFHRMIPKASTVHFYTNVQFRFGTFVKCN